MILRSEQIASYLREGEKADNTDPFVVTPPPDLARLEEQGAASLDLRLGCWFVTLRQARMSHLWIDRKTKPQPQLSKTHYIPFGKEYYLHPRSFVLGVTLEWMRLPKTLAGYVVGKSSWGRRGLIIATATAVHPGFKGCLTLELINAGEIPIGIRPGMEVCQLCIHQAGGGGSDKIDRSQFVGLRKPSLGSLSLDTVAQKLAEGYGST